MNMMLDAGPQVFAPAKALKRGRQRKSLRDRLCDLALERWFEWLLMTRLPRRTAAMVGTGDGLIETWTAMSRSSRSNVEHSDSVLASVIAEEAAGMDWAARIHEVIVEYPREWQLALLGSAMRYTQAQIGEALGMDQRIVSTLLSLVRSRFVPAILCLNSTRRHAEAALGECP